MKYCPFTMMSNTGPMLCRTNGCSIWKEWRCAILALAEEQEREAEGMEQVADYLSRLVENKSGNKKASR